MPRKKTVPAPEGASAPVGVVTVTYLGKEAVHFNGHSFSPDKPVAGLPAELIVIARRKPMFRVSDGYPE